MKKVLVKSLRNLSKIPTLEDMGMNQKDLQGGMRLEYDKNLGVHAVPTVLGESNTKFEQMIHDEGGQTIPGFYPGYGDNPPIDPKDLARGTFTFPLDAAALSPAHTQGNFPDLPNNLAPSTLLGILDKPDWRAGVQQGRRQAEGYQQYGFNPDSFVRLQNEVDIKNPVRRVDWAAAARDIMQDKNKFSKPEFQNTPYGIAHNVLSQLPKTEFKPGYSDDPLLNTWGGPSYDMFIPKSEPMDIAMRLLKERVSPEAKRHKLEYDKKYESSPERVKYREELNRERRRRHIMGQGGPDMSHTKDHTIVPEDSHTNRARHFKDKGTLL
tara:strand:+ start:5243 stop:6214 length:972 start_codon:yes stop_codon:yes gene_type:complete